MLSAFDLSSLPDFFEQLELLLSLPSIRYWHTKHVTPKVQRARSGVGRGMKTKTRQAGRLKPSSPLEMMLLHSDLALKLRAAASHEMRPRQTSNTSFHSVVFSETRTATMMVASPPPPRRMSTQGPLQERARKFNHEENGPPLSAHH